MRFATLLNRQIRKVTPMVTEMFNHQSRLYEHFFLEPKGLPGPVTFTGTPREVVLNMMRYQKGLSTYVSTINTRRYKG